MLQKLHEYHLGMVECKARVQSITNWPGVPQDIKETICSGYKPANHWEPRMPPKIPTRPCVAANLKVTFNETSSWK